MRSRDLSAPKSTPNTRPPHVHLPIGVSNTPGTVDETTATTTLYLVLSTAHHFSKAQRSLRAGTWNTLISPGAHTTLARAPSAPWGSAESESASPASHTPFPCVCCTTIGAAGPTSRSGACARWDVLSVHAPLCEETQALVGERQMKRGSVIVNTVRGGVVDEAAVIQVLEDGHVCMSLLMCAVRMTLTGVSHLDQLASVGLVVFPDEPRVNPRLLDFPQNVLLPYIGMRTQDTERKMEVCAMTNLRDFLLTGSGKDLVPELR